MSGRKLAEEVLSDHARIVACTAFRRLQTKAQVFSLETNAAVRSRLTHTLEVAMFGELIAGKVVDGLVAAGELEEGTRVPFTKTVANSCLLHDIGNPPFGHLGEYSLRNWMTKNHSRISELWKAQGAPEVASRAYLDSLCDFDGNAQGFRIVSRLQWLRHDKGLNLTCSLLAAMVKYLTSRAEPNTGEGGFRKKIGFFEAESETVRAVWSVLNLKWSNEHMRPSQRHPLAFLMEAADDIAYCLSDIEDALEKGVVSQDAFRVFIAAEGHERHWPKENVAKWSRHGAFIEFRTRSTRWLVDRAAELFLSNRQEALSGELRQPILDLDDECRRFLRSLKKFARENIFFSPEAVGVELSGFHIVTGLMDAFSPLLDVSREDFALAVEKRLRADSASQLALQSRLASLLSSKHRLAYSEAVDANGGMEPVFRLHFLVDYVAGMTDSHALRVFHTVRGFPALV